MDVTDDADASTSKLCERISGLTAGDVNEIPYALIGTVGQIADKLRTCRDRWGMNDFVVRHLNQFAPSSPNSASDPATRGARSGPDLVGIASPDSAGHTASRRSA